MRPVAPMCVGRLRLALRARVFRRRVPLRPMPRPVRSWLCRTRSIRVRQTSLGSLYGTVARELFHLTQFSYLPRTTDPGARRMGARGNGGGDGEPGLPRPGRHRLVAAALPTLVRGATAERDQPDLRVAAALALSRRASAAAASRVPHGERACARRRKRGKPGLDVRAGRGKNRSPRRSVALRCGRPTGTAISSGRCGDSRAAGKRLGGSVAPFGDPLSPAFPVDAVGSRCASLAAAVRRLHVPGRERSSRRPGRVPPAPRPAAWTAVAN